MARNLLNPACDDCDGCGCDFPASWAVSSVETSCCNYSGGTYSPLPGDYTANQYVLDWNHPLPLDLCDALTRCSADTALSGNWQHQGTTLTMSIDNLASKWKFDMQFDFESYYKPTGSCIYLRLAKIKYHYSRSCSAGSGVMDYDGYSIPGGSGWGSYSPQCYAQGAIVPEAGALQAATVTVTA
jgi:hypothetical protein